MTPHPAAILGHRPIRILHCPWNIAGQSAQLAAAERSLGADSRCVVLEETAKGFPADEVLAPAGARIISREIARWRLLWRAMRWADVVHFSFGQSCLTPNAYPGFDEIDWQDPLRVAWRAYCRLVWLKDLPLLAALGKRLAVTWQGDDARQHDRSLELFDTSIARALGNAYYLRDSDPWKRRTIAVFERHVPLQYALNPDLLHVLPARTRFLPYASLDPVEVIPNPVVLEPERPLVFMHAPSHRGAKGTAHVLAAAEQLWAEGLQFELRLVEGLARPEAMQQYAAGDLVIDQLLAGWYGGLAVEAMAMAKPVIAYVRQGDTHGLDADLLAQLPVISATPASIVEVMRQVLAKNRAELRAIGLTGRAFVEKWHDPRNIAAQTLSDYRTETK